MTINRIIAKVDELKPNAFSPGCKVEWISALEGRIAADVLLMGIEEVQDFQYAWPQDMERELLVKFPHDDIYALYVMAQIDAANDEPERYQNSMILFNDHYSNFVRWFAGHYEPANGCRSGVVKRCCVPEYYITAYGLAVQEGFQGTLTEWLASLKGEKGDPGAGVGEKTADGGEIFNNLISNLALALHTKADGSNTTAGAHGYRTLTTTADGTITVDDAALDGNRAIDNYAVGDRICFDGKKHWYHELKISALSTDDAGNTVITVAMVDGGDMVDLTRSGFESEFEDWVYVVDKLTAGIPGLFSLAAYAGGVNSVAIGTGANATGRDSKAIGNYSHAEGCRTEAGYIAHAEGCDSRAEACGSHAEGRATKAGGDYSHTEGRESVTEGAYSHAEGLLTIASGSCSHAEGARTKAGGAYSHAEGYMTTAEGIYSHAEGESTIASGPRAHAEGQDTVASGGQSHAEGLGTVASNYRAHAEGSHTIAAGANQHVHGRWNVEDKASEYAHIVGNGLSEDTRSNAHTLDWKGNAWFAGDAYIGGTGQDDQAAQRLIGHDKTAVSWNGAVKTGFYTPTADGPNEGAWFGYAIDQGNGQIIQVAFLQGNNSYVYRAQRSSADGGKFWRDWEWENPPVYVGTEYLTTERWNGKPVYTKLIDCGKTASAEYAKIAQTGLTTGAIIRHNAVNMAAGIALPHRQPDDTNNASSLWVTVDAIDYIAVWCQANSVGALVYCQIWYVKE